jgi:serine O-acetyltransferase
MQEMLNFWYMGGALARSIKLYNKYKSRQGLSARILCKYWKLRHLLMSVVTGSDFDPKATIGERLMLPHPNGVVVHANAVIGDDCMIMQQVTIGELSDGHAPVIGSRVYIGAGAKILGKVIIGDDARIGANAVVLCDVPPNSTAVGIPARILPSRSAR